MLHLVFLSAKIELCAKPILHENRKLSVKVMVLHLGILPVVPLPAKIELCAKPILQENRKPSVKVCFISFLLPAI